MPAYQLQKLFFLDTEAEILATRAKARALIDEGKTLLEVEGGGHKGTKAFPMPPAQVLFECNEALRYLNPRRYGRRRTRTYARQS